MQGRDRIEKGLIYVLWLFSHSISSLNQATEQQQESLSENLRHSNWGLKWSKKVAVGDTSCFRFIFYNSLHKRILAVLMKQQEHGLQRSEMLFTDTNFSWLNWRVVSLWLTSILRNVISKWWQLAFLVNLSWLCELKCVVWLLTSVLEKSWNSFVILYLDSEINILT